MHCNLRPPEPRQSFFRFYDAMPSLKSQNLSIAVYYSVSAADTLLYVVTLTFDPEHL